MPQKGVKCDLKLNGDKVNNVSILCDFYLIFPILDPTGMPSSHPEERNDDKVLFQARIRDACAEFRRER